MGPDAVRQGAQTRSPAPAFDPSAYKDLLELEGRHFWFLARKRLVREIIQQIAPRRVAEPCMPANPTDLAVIPFVNGFLERLLAVEIPLVLSRRRIPFGSSILALASRSAGPYGGGG